MPSVQLNATTTVEYLVHGEESDRPDLVLVHGTGGHASTNWDHLAEALGDGRRAIAPNYAGSGATTDHGGQLELSELVEQVAAAARHVRGTHAPPYDLVGFSLGAQVAAQLAATYPERVRNLVLIAGWTTSADPRMQLQFELWQELHARDAELLAQVMTLNCLGSTYLRQRPQKVVDKAVALNISTLAPGFPRQAELDQRIDLSAVLPRITAPTLVLGGSEDAVVPAGQARGLAEAIAGAQYVELLSGHLSLFEQPETLTRHITAFLAG